LRTCGHGSFTCFRNGRCLGLPFRGADIVHPRLRHAAKDRERFVYSAGPTVVGIAVFALAYPDSDEEILTDSSPDSLCGFYGKAHPVAGVSAVMIGALVEVIG